MEVTNKNDSPNVQFMPPSAFFICLVSGALFEFITKWHFKLSVIHIQLSAGIITCIIGFICMMSSHERFKKAGTAVKLNRPASKFIVSGAYRFSRNPMYLGSSLMFIGLAWAVGSWSILIAYFPFFCYLNFYVIPHEESYMKRAFGDEYTEYCKRVRRWL